MKSIKKFLFIMVALATTLAFVSCKDKEDEPSTVAVYKAEDAGEVSTVTFLDDNTWTWKAEIGGQSKVVYEGTYTGDPSKDNEISIQPNGSPSPIELTIANKKFEFSGLTFTRQ